MNKNFNLKISEKDKINNYPNIIKSIEKKSFNNNIFNIIKVNVGDIIKIEYNVSLEKDKIRIETYEGLIISKKNKNIILKRSINGINIEQILPLISPKIISITKKKSSKIRRSKLFFIRHLSEKKIRTKLQFY